MHKRHLQFNYVANIIAPKFGGGGLQSEHSNMRNYKNNFCFSDCKETKTVGNCSKLFEMLGQWQHPLCVTDYIPTPGLQNINNKKNLILVLNDDDIDDDRSFPVDAAEISAANFHSPQL